MPKDLSSQVIAQIDAQQKRPALLFELGLSSTIRFAAHNVNITFPAGGSLYAAKAIELSRPGQSIEGQLERITIKFDNVSRDMAAYAHNEDFRGKTLIVKRIYLDEIGDAAYYNEVFNGYMERPTEISRHWLTVPATTGKPLNRKVFKFHYQRMCPWRFGGKECNYDGHADLNTLTHTGTADSGTTSTLVDNALTQVDDYWNFGKIEITKNGKTYYRKVLSFSADTDTITLDVAIPVTIDNTCTYTVQKGCNKTWLACKNDFDHGPSADNSLNFGGCIHISQRQGVESYD